MGERTWTEVGREFITEAYASRSQVADHDEVRDLIAAQIDGLKWREPHGSLPYTPGEALMMAVREYELPDVSAVAISGYLRLPDGPETATYSLYGIEANFNYGRLRLYLLDAGGSLIPLAHDQEAAPDDATAR